MLAKRENGCYIKKMNLINTYYHWKSELIGWNDKNMSLPQMCTFWGKYPKSYFDILFPSFIILLIIKTSWAETVVMPILENQNTYVWSINSCIKKIKYI